MTKAIKPHDYVQVLAEIKHEVMVTQTRAVLSANKELLKLYWSIGEKLAKRQQEDQSWGTKIIEQLAADLQKDFPGIAGFSRSNVFRMQAFFTAYEKVAQLARQLDELPIFGIPWWHNVILMQKIKEAEERLWYAQRALNHGWSRSVLEMQIKSNLYRREGKAITNFKTTLPAPHSDLAQQSLRDPYLFDFLTLRSDYNERDVELGLIDHIQKFLLELGQGFAFVGRQYHLTVDGDDYYLDMLFYHLKLRCYIVVELKSTTFKPEFAGKLNFYLSAVDDLLKAPGDMPTIGLLLCSDKKSFTVEYALRDINKPIGVASYETQLVESLPSNLQGSLPSVEEIEAELTKKESSSESDS